jgi:hypothetical protein
MMFIPSITALSLAQRNFLLLARPLLKADRVITDE